MSKKSQNSELNSSNINIDNNENKNKNKNILIKQNYNINFLKKRKREHKKNDSLTCINCKVKLSSDEFRFKSKKDLIEKIKIIINNNNNYKKILNNNIKLISIISGKFKKSKILCRKCLENIIIKDNCVNKIKKIFFYNKRTKIKKKNSNFIKKKKSEIEKEENNNNEEDFINNEDRNNIININEEYEECLQNIFLYLKITIIEVSCFAQSFKLYFNNRSNIINFNHQYLIIEYFFHSYIQTKTKLEIFSILINRIIIKFQKITNKIIAYINKINSSDGNEEFKVNFDKFIQNTNLILSNILNFVNNYEIFFSFLRC